MPNDQSNMDYLDGNVIADMTVTKLANGVFQASSMGRVANHRDQAQAVLILQESLQEALQRGDLRPEM